ncbi:MAG: redox-regulated ATPase YchF [Nitrospina sp.]|jgi:ribosome-binding ATPase|nr:redox-regulated ATPase YchF [Nitrospina sp.]MBT3876709.1 redox-regulated ATPase YchF [Nitrospina sp.]MBT4047836.1 redox-regulated ATPase YchF [Nitrospina sp.]MBT4558603.1 redox-regulated ATPase YchF [Nitrospina sp.]MBT5349292.1 redox-regulated ATPase YchF [Nitrospina sp.]
MGFTCGLVGLPNAGKSTLFGALTRTKAQAGNYAFTTIEPNSGIVPVPDKRLDTITHYVQTKKIVPTTMEFVDIAGLIKGASKGEGLGNKFLGHIREVDAIAHVVRCFEDGNVPHVSDIIDPASDIDTINTELIISDIENLDRRKTKIEKLAKSGDKEARMQVEVIAKLAEALDQNQPARAVKGFNDEQEQYVKSLTLLSAKPVLYICNVMDPGDTENELVQKVKQIAEQDGSSVVALAGKIEGEIMEIEDPEEQQMFMEEMGLTETGLDRMISAGYGLLELSTYFTAGEKETRAWTIPKNAKAPVAAGVIHTDFEKGFIRAEVYSLEDLVLHKSEAAIKEAGKLRVEGKDYTVQDGDIMHFRFNV